jgi:transcriptional regulator with XRE-family HTH domain
MGHRLKRYDRPIPVNGNLIYQLRKEAQLSLRAFERASDGGISRTTLNQAENSHPISPGRLQVIAAVLTHILGRPITPADLTKEDQQR